jgi:hypothetical protein
LGTRCTRGEEFAAFEAILNLCPDVIVLEDATALGCERPPKMGRLLALLARTTEAKGLVVVGRFDVRRRWSARGVTGKHAVAAIAEDSRNRPRAWM